MKGMKLQLVVLASAVALSTPAWAFHAGGVAECEGCHTMYNSYEWKIIEKEDGTAVPLATKSHAGPFLLKANDQSGSCLNCHESTPGSYHISTPGVTAKSGPNTVNPVTQYT